jgi:hypothetical protein
MRASARILIAVCTVLLAAGRLPAQAPAAPAVTPGPGESHEGLTITARPWTDPAEYKRLFPKKNPFTAGIVAIEVTFRNDSGDSLRVDLERIRLVLTISEDSRQDIAPLSSEDVADRVFKPGATDPTARRNRFPIPRSKSPATHSKEWTTLEAAVRQAGPSGSIIAPHARMQGLLYFDLANQFDLLTSAKLYIPNVVSLEKNRALFYFEIDLSRSSR